MSDEFRRTTISQGMGRLRRIYGHLTPRRRLQFALLVMLSLISAVAELITIGAVLPVLFIALQPEKLGNFPLAAETIGRADNWLGLSPLTAAAILLAVAAVTATAMRLLIQWYSQRLVFALNHDLSTRLYGRILRQPFEWHAHHHSTIILSAIEKVYQISIGVVLPLVNALSGLLIALFVVALLFAINPVAAALAALVVGLVYAVLVMATRTRNAAAAIGAARLRDQRMKTIQESGGGIRDIVLDQTQQIFERRFADLDIQFNRVQVWNQIVLVLPRLIVEGALIVLIALLALWFSRGPGGLLIALPALGAMAIGAQRLLPLVQQVYAGYSGYSLAIGQIDDVLDLLDTPVDETVRPMHEIVPLPFEHDIRFASVNFSYHNSKPALHDVSLTISAGERIGIIGRTGSGKSTFVDLLMGLLRPESGDIFVDGVALDSKTIARWKRQIAHVPQHIFLADDSIAANVAFGQTTVDRARVRQSLDQAGLGEWLNGLPTGVDTFVGERGIRLSGGQRQRIGIARALYKDAKLLVLDEATSSLDNETEQLVMDAVNALRHDLTIVIIAHRLSTVEPCDRIVKLEAGRIASIGSYADIVGARKSSG